MSLMKISEIARLFGSETDFDGDINEIVTDSRLATKGNCFFAIVGENMDAHNFIDSAIDNGVSLVVASKKASYKDNSKVIYVEDTRLAHIELGRYYKEKFDVSVIGVTGSVGKTTTKEFIAALLSGELSTLKNEGNLNNELGLPKTLFKLDNSHQVAVLEMGMSSFGEIHNLSVATKPDIAVITNIGLSHVEILGSRENIFKAKLEMLDGMKAGSVLIVSADDDMLSSYQNKNYKVLKYGVKNRNADVFATNITFENEKTTFTINYKNETYNAEIPAMGEHNVLNALAAFLIGVSMGIDENNAVKYLKNYKPSGMRQNFTEKNGIMFVEDCYNSAPNSLLAAVKTLAGYKAKGRKILVVSDMLELGDMTEPAHKEAGREIADYAVDIVLGCGEATKYLIDEALVAGKSAKHFESKDELKNEILREIKNGDIIWFKASRGMRLEEVIMPIYEEM